MSHKSAKSRNEEEEERKEGREKMPIKMFITYNI